MKRLMRINNVDLSLSQTIHLRERHRKTFSIFRYFKDFR